MTQDLSADDLVPHVYLEAALDLIQAEALRAPEVDWPTVRAQAHAMIAGATSSADTYPAIELVLRALGDHHSFLHRPGRSHGATPGGFGLKYVGGVIARIYPDSPAARAGLSVGDVVLAVNGQAVGPGINGELPREGDATLTVRSLGGTREVFLARAPFTLNRVPVGRMLRPGVAWLDLPDHGGEGTLPDGRLYQDVVQGLIGELLASGARGWVVDLRLNEGGNMYPMLAGAGPLTGEGQLGAFVRDGEAGPWTYEGGAALVNGYEVCKVFEPPHAAVGPEVPVAVLTSPLTSSSGEVVTISFRGRPNTRSFGEPTQGLTTANSLYQLADGAEVFLATCYEADRTGRVYTREIEPDEAVPTDWGAYLSEGDGVLAAAVAWVEGRI